MVRSGPLRPAAGTPANRDRSSSSKTISSTQPHRSRSARSPLTTPMLRCFAYLSTPTRRPESVSRAGSWSTRSQPSLAQSLANESADCPRTTWPDSHDRSSCSSASQHPDQPQPHPGVTPMIADGAERQHRQSVATSARRGRTMDLMLQRHNRFPQFPGSTFSTMHAVMTVLAPVRERWRITRHVKLRHLERPLRPIGASPCASQ